MSTIYNSLFNNKRKKNLAVLIDPDKTNVSDIPKIIYEIKNGLVTHLFVGGSRVKATKTQTIVNALKNCTALPIVLFPGDVSQITEKADALLFLSLISGRNPDYLIGKHVEAVSKLNGALLEIIPTAYILIENGKKTAVEQITKTKPLARANVDYIVNTAKAGELLGMKLIYLEAGSGAKKPIPSKIIRQVKTMVNIPIIVGGGIRSKTQLDKAYDAGADLVVIGNAFEEDQQFFNKLKAK